VAKLFKKGTAKIAQKVGEEGVEVAIEAVIGHKENLKEECADLLFHLLVLLIDQDISLTDVISVLSKRHDDKKHKHSCDCPKPDAS
jgi:phosphoribosyl-ATP pyrophosphohydrolase/phosphoribosyl-AMP cyclohydrolase